MQYRYGKFIRCIASAALAVSLVLGMASCDSGGAPGDATEEQTESNVPDTVVRHGDDPDLPILAKAYLDALPTEDFDGASFLITTADTTLFDPDEVNYLSDTVEKRNRMVEEKYNIKLGVVSADVDSMLEDVKQSALAGMYYSDIMSIPLKSIYTFASAGVLTNLNSVPALDLTEPYFNASSVSAMTAGYETYGVAGEATPASADLPAVIFNRDIADSVIASSLYDEAQAGKFTWDRFFEYASLCDASSGVAGAVCEVGSAYDAIYVSCGGSYVSSGVGKIPTVDITYESVALPMKAASNIGSLSSGVGIGAAEAADAFAAGGALFTVGYLRDLDRYRTGDVNIGILPMPKADEDCEIRSLVSSSAPVLTVASGATGGDIGGLVISALCASSYGYITEAYDNYLHVTTLPDNRSADMLEIISSTAIYDFTTVFGESDMTLYDGTVGIIRSVMGSGSTDGLEIFSAEAQAWLRQAYPCDR